jgi:hypothetical protein
MADTKLADLTALTTPSGDDILYIVDDPAGTPLDRKIALDNLFTRGTITADAPVLNMSQTWNNGAVTFTGLKFNATDTASNAASLLMDIGVGGGTYTSRFKVNSSTGLVTVARSLSAGGDAFAVNVSSGATSVYNTGQFGWTNAGSASTSLDTILTRRAAANLRLGAADAATPVAQTLSVQSRTGTDAAATAYPFTITGSQGTGTGAGGSIIFQVAPAGSTGSAQNALVDALTIDAGNFVRLRPASTTGSLLTSGDNGFRTLQLLGPTYGSNGIAAIRNDNFVAVRGSGGFAWESNANNPATGTLDLILARDAANTLALRNGTNAQAFRVYNTTDGTNSEYGFMKWNGTTFEIGAEKSGTGSQRSVTIRSNSGVLTLADGNSDFQLTSGVVNLGTRSIGGLVNISGQTGHSEMIEMTAPAAPAANRVRIYAVDNGSGKTQLMALFATGAAQQIAIEP